MKGTIKDIISMMSSCPVGRSADEMEGNMDVDIIAKEGRGGGEGGRVGRRSELVLQG